MLTLPALFAFLVSPPAEILPGFDIAICSWHATHVVVATEGDKIDGWFEVLDVWRGDLKVGAKFRVPGMERMAPPKMREEAAFFRRDQRRLIVTGARMVLFLRKVGGEFKTAHRYRNPPGARRRNDPEYHDNDVTLSAAWIYKDQVFARQQVINPGEQRMSSLGMNEPPFRSEVLRRLVERDAIASLGRVESPAHRARGLEKFLRSTSWPARDAAMRHMVGCKKAAIPALRRLMHDEAHMNLCRDAALALVKIDPAIAREEMTAVIRKDFAAFRAAVPTLEKGWWNGTGLDQPFRRKLQTRHGRLYYVLYELGQLGGEIDKGLVAEIKEFWMAQPQLTDLDQVPNTCHKILARKK